MDPVSVVSLVAACASLAKTCAGIAKTLHSLVETYKFAELAILSITEECETVQLAWDRIEQWAKSNLHQIDRPEQIIERLQRSVYCGQLVMSALETEIAKITGKSRAITRGSMMAWANSLLQEHQTRLRGQVTSLQLLLQVLSL